MRRLLLVSIISCFVFGLTLAGCAHVETTTTNAPVAINSPAASPAANSGKISSTDVVKASAAPLEMAAGGAAMVSVKIEVKEGYHINANPPTFPYLKATEVSVEAGEGLTASQPSYPPSVTRTFAFAEKPLAVYEGATEIKLPLKAAATAAKGARTLPLRLRVQACDEKACYPPGTLNIPVGVTIK
ncbi:MAG TPA: protein-disulfide reductase DsbD domain-containing protein [Pyrinomonadaceae bacterium]|jgi:thiol:disulfide interchange protein DsbD|nr:protein-disulfide reductase DsbD domain-containing protein [Pyrinomonadaceae bacterium]